VKIAQFDYPLPEELVAQEPLEPRDASRLLVVPREGTFEHLVFRDLADRLQPGDLLVLNDTRVIPARLVGTKASGGRCELLLLEPLDPTRARWRALGQSSKPLRPGTRVAFGALTGEVEAALGEGFFDVRFDLAGDALDAAVEREGRMPLPPYIRRAPREEDRARYQTVIAREPGSAAAPTAGLHFTPELLARLDARGVERATVTLHVGPGTFLPVRGDDLDAHVMHEERYDIPPATADAFAACRQRGQRIVAVGTTVVRALESACSEGGLRAGPGRTRIFIRPGHEFRAVDALVTNLHLPRSTLLVLVCAFRGRERVLAAYAEAVAQRYRFFSYGDAMLLE
jgi:S-adenosylmethionine:tRNA ribosyltransferase-isomerase